jgi:hypothetical protein
MSRIAGIAALAFILTASAMARAADSVKLWGASRSGMTVEQVLGAVPGTARHDPSPGESVGNATEQVRGPVQTIAGEKFIPHFYFERGALVQVTLGLEGISDAYQAFLTFQGVADALRAKYGKELSLRQSSIGWDGEWISSRTNISLALITIEGATPLLNIVYQTRVSGDEDKL